MIESSAGVIAFDLSPLLVRTLPVKYLPTTLYPLIRKVFAVSDVKIVAVSHAAAAREVSPELANNALIVAILAIPVTGKHMKLWKRETADLTSAS